MRVSGARSCRMGIRTRTNVDQVGDIFGENGLEHTKTIQRTKILRNTVEFTVRLHVSVHNGKVLPDMRDNLELKTSLI